MPNGPPRKIRVVFLDDCLFARDSLERLVIQFGLEVAGAHEKAPAFFETIRREAPDVAVLDLFMQPGPQRLLEQIRDLPPPRPKVMVFASQTDEDMVERAREAGVQRYLQKRSTDVPTLVRAVTALAEGQAITEPLRPSSETHVPSSEDARRLQDGLSDREREVLGCIAAGWDNMKIAAVLGITERTVRAHVSALYRKLDCENRAAMALLGYRMGLGRN